MLDLEQSIKLAEIQPGDPKDMLRGIAIKGAERFLDILPPGIAAALELAGDAAEALEGLQNGDVSGWLGLLQQAQSRWIDYIGKQWDLLESCRDTIRVDAAERTPIAAWSKVPIKLACGVGKQRKPGRIYWRPYGIGPRIENWAHDIPTAPGGNKQVWVPDDRKYRADGYVFCPAVYPYCIPGELPTTWGEGVAAVMGVRYQELLMDGSDSNVLDDLFYRIMAIINSGKLWRQDGKWENWNPVQVVQEIPANPDPAFIYSTPRGELWAVSDSVKLRSYWNLKLDTYTPYMTATIGQLRTMLGSLGGLMVRERLAAGATPPKGDPGIPPNTWQFSGGEKGTGGGGGGGKGGGKGGGGGGSSSGSGAALLVGGLAAGALYLRSRKGRR